MAKVIKLALEQAMLWLLQLKKKIKTTQKCQHDVVPFYCVYFVDLRLPDYLLNLITDKAIYNTVHHTEDGKPMV